MLKFILFKHEINNGLYVFFFLVKFEHDFCNEYLGRKQMIWKMYMLDTIMFAIVWNTPASMQSIELENN